MKLNKLLVFFSMCLTLGITSCVDDGYDLDDVDMTLGVKTDLTLPTSSVGDILLRNVMNLEEDGIVALVPSPLNPNDSIYVVKQSGTADIKPVKINEIRIAAPKVDDFTSDVYLKEVLHSSAKAKASKSLAFSNAFTIKDETYKYVIEENQAKQTINTAKAKNISEDVVSIENVKIDRTNIIITLNISGFPSHISKMHLDGLSLSLPEDLHVSSCHLNGVAAESIKPGLINITKAVDGARSINEPLVLTLAIDGATTGDDFVFDANKHEASLCGLFKTHGTFRIETSEMDKEKISAIVTDYLTKHPDIHEVKLTDIAGIVPEKLSFTGKTSFDRDLHITHVSGAFQHEVGAVEPLMLDDIPDFLDDEDVVLDLENPMVFLNFTNSFPVDVKTNLTFTSETDNNTPRSTGEMNIAGNRSSYYYLAEKEENRYLPAEHSNAEWKKVEGLPNLIKRIPKKVNVNISKVTMQATDLDITREYPIEASYDVYAPLVFGPDFYLTYTDTDNNWDIDDDLGKMNAEAVTATATITSNIPAAMTLYVDLIDLEGKKIDIVEDISVACSANAKNEPITISIKAKSGHELRELLSGKDVNGNKCQKLDGMRYRAVLNKPSEGQALNGESKILIKDVKVSLKGVVTFDAN